MNLRPNHRKGYFGGFASRRLRVKSVSRQMRSATEKAKAD